MKNYETWQDMLSSDNFWTASEITFSKAKSEIIQPYILQSNDVSLIIFFQDQQTNLS